MFETDKMYTFVTGYASGANLKETKKALPFAREQHKDQKRKGGEPYFVHPLTMACHALSMHINDDNVIAAILLHDVVEDCDIKIQDIPVNKDIKRAVKLLTFQVNEGEEKESAKKRYYHDIGEDKTASLAKIIDRCHNVSSMAGVFSEKKLEQYISETKEYVMPLIRKAKDAYPEYRDQLFLLKYQIESIVIAIEMTMQEMDRQPFHKPDNLDGGRLNC